jgi:hypothetical protein
MQDRAATALVGDFVTELGAGIGHGWDRDAERCEHGSDQHRLLEHVVFPQEKRLAEIVCVFVRSLD